MLRELQNKIVEAAQAAELQDPWDVSRFVYRETRRALLDAGLWDVLEELPSEERRALLRMPHQYRGFSFTIQDVMESVLVEHLEAACLATLREG